MKNLRLFILLLFAVGLAQSAKAQSMVDSIKFNPDYICQATSFSISMRVAVNGLPGSIDSVKHYFGQDTLYVDAFVTNGLLTAIGHLNTSIVVQTPQPGRYTLYFKRFMNGFSGSPVLFGTQTDSFYVCMRAPLLVPENTSKNQLAAEIFPNPASAFVTIQLPESNNQPVTANLTDVTGKQVLSQVLNSQEPANQINIGTLPTGIYVLQLKSGASFKIVKIVKQ